jgi:predicted ATPase
VGRGLELAELHALAGSDAHRLVTIRGPGGSGKSRVARQLARERAGHHEDGAAWAPLTHARHESDAVATIARALGVRAEGDAEALAGVLADVDLLLVLDDAEHVADLPGLVVTLLDACPRLRVVVASRAVLDVPGEAVMPLAGLSVPPRDDAADAEAYDAVGLLLRAAHRVRPGFHPRGAERTAAVALTRTLEGGPLAIELAAGWLRVLEPSELMREIERDLDVLRSDREQAPSRHVSLRAVFESSWSLLGESERESARRLAVFEGGCTRDTAAVVADVPLGTLLTLTNRSMLHRDDRTRFAAHAMVGRFAREKLAERPELERELTRRHAAYFLALAEDADRRLDTPEQADALARLDAESGNLTAALRRAVDERRGDVALALSAALGRWWRWRGRAREGLDWYARVRTLGDADAPSTPGVRSLLAEGLLLEKVGAYDEADRAFERALEHAMRLGDAGLVAAARTDQATVAWRRGDLRAASDLLAQAATRYRDLGRDAALAGTLNNLGNVARDAGDLADAHARYDEALHLAEGLGHAWEVANVRNNKAIAHAYGGDLEAARGEFERALALQRSIDDRPGVSKSLTNLGNVHLDTGRPAQARELYGEALELCEETGDREGAAHLYVNLGILAQRDGAFDEAHELYARALRIRRELGARALAAQSVSCFLDLAVARGDHERALVLAGSVRTLCAAVGVPLTAPQQETYDAALAAARAAVPAGRASELEARGAALGERETVAFALAERAAAW